MHTFDGSRLTGSTCSKVPGFWMVEHQLVFKTIKQWNNLPNDVIESNSVEHFVSAIITEQVANIY